MFDTSPANIFNTLKESISQTVISFYPIPDDGKLPQTDEDLYDILKSCDEASSSGKTVGLLKSIVGEKRLERIFKRPELGLDWDEFVGGRLPITKDVMQRIWMGLADVRIEDIQEKCSDTQDLDKLYASLLPSSKVKDIFFDEAVNVGYYDNAHSSGKLYSGLKERVWTVHHHREHVLSGAQNTDFADLEMLTSRLAEREPPVGSVIRLGTGYYVADHLFSGGGAYVTMWKSLGQHPHYILACRGTATRGNATEGYMSTLNDFLPEIGFYGVRSIWPGVKQYLASNKIKQVDIIGKSLGGSHAQYLATLITGLTGTEVHSLKTCCSAGTPESVQKLFEKGLVEKRKPNPVVDVYRNGGDIESDEMDFIPCVGGPHLYAPGTTRFIYVTPKEKEDIPFVESYHKTAETLEKLLVAFRSLGKAHARQNSLKEYSLIESHDIDVEKNVGTRLESWRSLAAFFVNAVTFRNFDTETFEQYYESSCS